MTFYGSFFFGSLGSRSGRANGTVVGSPAYTHTTVHTDTHHMHWSVWVVGRWVVFPNTSNFLLQSICGRPLVVLGASVFGASHPVGAPSSPQVRVVSMPSCEVFRASWLWWAVVDSHVARRTGISHWLQCCHLWMMAPIPDLGSKRPLPGFYHLRNAFAKSNKTDKSTYNIHGILI